MLWNKLLGANAAGEIQYIGSVTKSADGRAGWDSAEEALDVLSIANVGDLVVIAFSSDDGSGAFTWNGMNFTTAFSEVTGAQLFGYVGFRFIEGSDSNPFISSTANFYGLSIVASVFRNVSAYGGVATTSGSSGMPNPALNRTSGNLHVITGHLDDDQVTNWGAPSGYSLAASAVAGTGVDRSGSTAIAYRIEDLDSQDPGAFTGSGSDDWLARTLAFLK